MIADTWSRRCGWVLHRGFAIIELMVVLLVIAILATIAIPSYADRIALEQVGGALTLATFAEQTISTQYSLTAKLPANNAAAGLPPPDHIVGNYVSSIEVDQGQLNITFGNQANRRLTGKILTVRPATVIGYPQVPISWICASAQVPKNMVATGTDNTNLPLAELPYACRAG